MKNYKFWLILLAISSGIVATLQGCGKADTATTTTHVIYGATS